MKDMTQGRPAKVILTFALPMILSGIIQQCYNLADSVIAGNFAGMDALAAVGASTPITVLFISMGNGAGMGCSVVIAQLFGAKKLGRLKTSVYTAILSFVCFGVLLLGVGSLLTGPFLRVLNTPGNIFADAAIYLRVYMFGLPFLLLYNICNAIFNALGDSKKPLVFLIISSLLNIGLDIWFVAVLGWGVAGVAWATFIAQGLASLISAAALLLKMREMKTAEPVRPFELDALKGMARIGLPTMVQLSIVSVGSLFVQALVNGYGAEFIAGYSAALKIHNFFNVVIHTIGSAIGTFTAQNIGAGDYDRPVQGMKAGLLFNLGYNVVFIALCLLAGGWMVSLFVDSGGATPQVLAAGKSYLWAVALGGPVFTLMNCFNGVNRGAGYMVGFTVSTLLDLAVRVVACYGLVGVIGQNAIAVSVPLGWLVGAAMAFYYFRSGKWRKVRVG